MNYSRIILLTVDCLRASAIHCLGGRSSTKNIDRLAQDGILFTQAVANGPGTPQSFPAIFTSTYPLMHKKIVLSSRYTTLAEVLRRNGFACAGFHSNPFLSKFFGWDRGFGKFCDCFKSMGTASDLVLKSPPQLRSAISKIIDKGQESNILEKLLAHLRTFYGKTKSQPPYLPGQEMNELIIEWVKTCKSKKIFLWVHYMDPHSPYFLRQPKPKRQPFHTKGKANQKKAFYESEVKYVDNCIGELVKTLEELGLLNDALIFLTADHGEGFGEHKVFQHFNHVLYEELIHVPLIIHGLYQSKKIDTPVGLIDIAPTILSLLKITKPKTFYGKSMLPLVGEETDTREGVISESAHYNFKDFTYNLRKSAYSYRGKKWKLILNNIIGKKELYNLEDDPYEQTNVLQSNRGVAKILTSKLAAHVRQEKKNRYHASRHHKMVR